ncbi:hypothetical protein EUX98_g7162 [Antrodiella citrinella]|uniref:ATP-dependent DNA helicase n=1 Tax=Antrodiella citrinella TaxID=2447956 RepID=A0A4V3XHX4_9APHY|nr:hypothetical protein EUX98_g7162 [Antrodiella citrinella]
MSSDDYFDGEVDSAFLNEVDAIEAAHVSPRKRTAYKSPVKSVPRIPPRQVIEIADSDEDYDVSGFNDDALLAFDEVCAAQPANARASTSARPMIRRSSMGTIQTNLFGQVVSQEASSSKAGPASRKPMSRTTSTVHNPLANRSKRTKQWDHTVYAKYGWKKSKGKEKASFDGEEDEEMEMEDAVEFEQFPAPSAPVGPLPPMKLKPDLLAARRWLYPLNKPKRDYQFNIVKKCLFENTLVAIPTGLGKTFIAGVVMLNFYNWFPEGKVVFVAPTRPLVAQQISACHETCGIPGSHAAELTGQNPKAYRGKEWQSKRVFYMTPQTLMNDIRNEVCDCRDIVLLVVDEAHKGTGDYAYAQVVRYLMAKNPHFRLLALTATPGSSPDAVQSVVDSLHISHVEIRNEESLDLRQYLHQKRVQQHIIPMNNDIMRIADLLVALMQYEGSMSMCFNYLKTTFADEKKSKKPTKMQQDPKFQALMQEVDLQCVSSTIVHPKKEKLLDLIIQHFGAQIVDENGAEITGSESSRVMIFSTFRENVDDLTEMLNQHNPLIRAVRFIGQGTDKQGRKGYSQKEQMDVIQKFKAGEYNVLVSTSVGEEGLDIGEVDMIICYESQKTPIRMLQRVGRTGRKKDGVVHVLLAEGREDDNWNKAKEKYEDVQHSMVSPDQLELYDDVSRMLPDNCKPDCIEMVMDIEEYNREENTKKASVRSPTKTAKRKRDDNMLRNIPEGAATSFVSVKDLLVKGAKKRKKPVEFDPLACEDDDDDRAIMEGPTAPRRTTSLGITSKATKAKKPRRAATVAGASKDKRKTAKPRKKKPEALATADMTASQLDKLVEDDSDDKEIEAGFFAKDDDFVPLKSTIDPDPMTPPSSPSKRTRRSPSFHFSSPDIPLNTSIIDLTTPVVGGRPTYLPAVTSPSLGRATSSSRSLESSEFNVPRKTRSPSAHSRTSDRPDLDASLAWLIADDDEPEFQLGSSPVSAKASSSKVISYGQDPDDSVILLEDYVPPISKARPKLNRDDQESDDSIEILEDYVPPSPSERIHSQPLKPPALSQDVMPPPVLPSRFNMHPPTQQYDMLPPSTFAPRAPGIRVKKRTIPDAVESSPSAAQEPVPKRSRIRRLQDLSSSPPPQPAPRRKKRMFKDASEAAKRNPWVEYEAEHSGDERSVGTSGAEDADEYEASFVQDVPETQASPSYDQSAVYRQSLLTQAPGNIPRFANRLARHGPPARAASGPSRRPLAASSSPRRTDEEPDEYVFGSFVVADDDDEMPYVEHSSDI